MEYIIGVIAVFMLGMIAIDAIERRFKRMNYKLALRNLFEMIEIVLVSIFTITHLIGSVILFISTLCIRELGHTDSHHTVDISMFGYKYTLTTKK